MKKKMSESKAIKEVRAWKEKVARDTKNLKGKALLGFYNFASARLTRSQAA